MSTPTHESKSESRPASGGTHGNTITCSICQAVYAPAQEHGYLAQAPRLALESTFMSMCHFCFRCRRPACPNCWDYVHGVCGSCTLEAGLPFRSRVPSLRGVVFPPLHKTQLQHRRSAANRLVCTRPGLFQHVAPLDSAETLLMQTVDAPPVPSSTATYHTPTEEPPPLPALPQPIPYSKSHTPLPPPVDIDEIATRPERVNKTAREEVIPGPEPHQNIVIDEIETKPERPANAPHREPVPPPSPRQAPSPRPARGRRSRIKHIERISVLLVCALLLIIALLIALAELSQDANTIFLQLLHVDIRAEIAYILQLLRQVIS